MSPEFHQRVRDLFDEALEKPESERRGFVRAACGDDLQVLRAVTELLDAHGQSDSFLEQPAAPGAQRIGRYQVVRELGRGGMGVVYEALDPLIARTVAVKLIHLKSLATGIDADQTWKQLLTEAQSAGLLSHPGIVVVYDVGQENEEAFIAMERVEGPSLQQVLDQNKKLSGPIALDVLRQTAAALDYAHQSGVLHRDIKPANIMVHRGSTVKITDFGLAKITSNPRHTRTQAVMGTPGYMSPERISMGPLDGRCDQFSLAVIAFQALTGERPFEGNSIPEVLYRITSRERPSARALDPRLPAAVDQVLHRGLAIRAQDRYASCAAFVMALQEALRSGAQPAPASRPPASPPQPPPPPPSTPPRQAPPSTPPLAATRVATPAPLAPTQPEAVRRKPRRWPLVLMAATGSIVAVALGVFGVRKFAPPPAETAVVTPVLPPVGQKTVEPPPSITRFSVEPDTIEPGGTARLTWEVSGAKEVEIVPSVGVVAASGTSAVKPGSPTNYLLTATSPGGRVKASVLVDVRAKSPGTAAIKPSNAPRTPEKPATTPEPPPQKQNPPAQAPAGNTPQARHLFDQATELRRAGQAARAIEVFRSAADLGDLRAMVEIGKMYRAGEGITPDLGESARWFRKAADAGHPPAMVLVGLLYFEGKSYPKDLTEAVRWFRKAAAANDPVGMDELGQMYSMGWGVGKDEREAFLWFEKSAKAGNQFGLFHLGRCYERGTGVSKDLNEARSYYEKAAAAGNADAKQRLAQLGGASTGTSTAAANAVTMSGSQQWTDSGITLQSGDNVSITASGSITVPGVQNVPAMTPAGSSANCQAAAALYGTSPGSPSPALPCWSLIGRVGPSGAVFPIGASKSFRVAGAGELFLGINHDTVQENLGNWRAIVNVQR
jgi:serine/threonine protein kinase/TPR repeat protein